jgi:DNA repair protein RecO (recombination protein O)
MEWTASGRIIAVRPHGETSAVIEVLTAEHGRHAGLVRGGRSRPCGRSCNRETACGPSGAPGLRSHLGGFQVEAEDLSAGVVMDDPLALSGLNGLRHGVPVPA